MRKILLGGLVVAVFFGGTLWVLDTFFGDSTPARRPALAEPPPLQAVSRLSTVIAPVAVASGFCRPESARWRNARHIGRIDCPGTPLAH